MHRIKKSIFLLLAILCISTTTCFAYGIPRNDMAIGGVTLGTSLDYVKQIYGSPTSSYYEEGDYMTGKIAVYSYNQMFVIYAGTKNHPEGRVYSVICRDKGLSTPAGFAVGMKFDIVKKIYGYPNETKYPINPVEGCRHYEYNTGSYNMQFAIDSNKIIRQIVVYSGV